MKPSFDERTSSHEEDDEHFDCGMWVDMGARQAPGLAFSLRTSPADPAPSCRRVVACIVPYGGLPSVRLHQLLRVVAEHPRKQALAEQSCCKLKYNG